MSLHSDAEHVLSILESGSYRSASGRLIDISSAQQAAVEGTRLYEAFAHRATRLRGKLARA